MSRISYAVLALVALVITGCAPKPVPYDRESAAVRSIGVVTPHLPDGSVVFVAASVGSNFGIVGALVDAGIQANRENIMDAAYAENGVAPSTILQDSVIQAIRGRGYDVKIVEVSRESSGEFLKNYPDSSASGVDAYLDIVTIDYGYVAAAALNSTPFRPAAALKVQLVNARDSTILMQDIVLYNPLNAREDMVTISPDPKYSFPDFEALETSPELASEGVRASLISSAEAIANLLN